MYRERCIPCLCLKINTPSTSRTSTFRSLTSIPFLIPCKNALRFFINRASMWSFSFNISSGISIATSTPNPVSRFLIHADGMGHEPTMVIFAGGWKGGFVSVVGAIPSKIECSSLKNRSRGGIRDWTGWTVGRRASIWSLNEDDLNWSEASLMARTSTPFGISSYSYSALE